MDLNDIAIDLDKDLNGTWIEYDKQTSFKIARWENENFINLYDKYLPKIKQLQSSLDDEKCKEEYFEIENKLINETILIAWKGLLKSGEELPYSKGEALNILNNKSLQHLRNFIILNAGNQANYRVKEIEDSSKTLKNS